ncbi:polysaccharide pyruvyl transferase family protein [Colwellia sp. C1TZA3]|uniref:polysaccharide pyruvyl transferase family protein n=1 Tax=Colwellia sp. C1TZA3 TaxID=2508879 RepID=UPI0011B9C02B|nr:polysaccharide pyruvyl transferase family protein [Colwellia sp. C1TZA3]TWX67499.1 polysaccharide pyruvyl transferase family protein [Colwellia sp. C1TZA3]
MKELKVEVKGIGFPNKGAELMLAAIIQQFDQRGVAAQFSVEPYGDYKLRASHGLFQKARVNKFGLNIGALIGLLPKKFLKVFGIIRAKDIDVVLDASGFSYGDQWGPHLVNYRLGTTIKSLKKRGVKVVLLPQAFGPFENIDTKKAAENIMSQSDLVFARDPKSFEYCQSLVGGTQLELCPDFTNLVVGNVWNDFDTEMYETCFIPNSKMLEKTDSGNDYINLMVHLVDFSHMQGKKPFLLIHEGKADRELAKKIVERVSFVLDVIEPVDPLKIKWVIGQSKVVVSSRFHGLVSALSQGIPVVATGWSHKYLCLLEDYNVADALIDVKDGVTHGEAYLDKLLNDDGFYTITVDEILVCSAKQKQKVRDMWNKTFATIGTE